VSIKVVGVGGGGNNARRQHGGGHCTKFPPYNIGYIKSIAAKQPR
jgi:hypothetical protein